MAQSSRGEARPAPHGTGRARRVAIPLVTTLAILVAWQLLVVCGIVPNFMLPTPTQVMAALVGDFPLLVSNSATTLAESALGLVIGCAVGFAFAVLMDRFEGFRLAFSPLITI